MQDLTGCEGHVPRAWAKHAPARTSSITWLLRLAQVRARIRRHAMTAALDSATGATGFILAVLLLLTAKIGPRLRATRVRPPSAAQEAWSRVLIVGAGATGTMLAQDFQLNHSTQVHVVGFV